MSEEWTPYSFMCQPVNHDCRARFWCRLQYHHWRDPGVNLGLVIHQWLESPINDSWLLPYYQKYPQRVSSDESWLLTRLIPSFGLPNLVLDSTKRGQPSSTLPTPCAAPPPSLPSPSSPTILLLLRTIRQFNAFRQFWDDGPLSRIQLRTPSIDSFSTFKHGW